jgi:UDP-2-acetamido-3-amino-2,3-dideoxy-glucuronate N-acetyltransferase
VAPPQITDSADVDARASIGADCVIWHLAQIREGAVIGDGSVIGRGAYVDREVRIGRRAKVQNHALVYAPASIGDGVFIGPGAILTNDPNPRAVAPDGSIKGADDWQAAAVTVEDGAAIGARAVVIAGVTIGTWALVGAGAVVTRDVAPHALVVGNPARQIGWVGRAGVRLAPQPGHQEAFRCPRTGETYRLVSGRLHVDPEPSAADDQHGPEGGIGA